MRLGRIREDRRDTAGQPLGDRVALIGRQLLEDRRLTQPLDHRVEQAFLICEASIDGLLAHIGGLGDRIDRRPVEAVFDEIIRRDGHQPLAFAIGILPRWPSGAPPQFRLFQNSMSHPNPAIE